MRENKMRGLVFLSVLIALLLSVANAQTSVDWGSCQRFPNNTEIYGWEVLAGELVWIPDYISPVTGLQVSFSSIAADLKKGLDDFHSVMEFFPNVDECLAKWDLMFFYSAFPLCVEVDGILVPQRQCKTGCEWIWEETCKLTFDLVTSFVGDSGLPKCDLKLGATDNTAGLFSLYITQLLGREVFPAASEELIPKYNDSDGSSVTVPCSMALYEKVTGLTSGTGGSCNFEAFECPEPFVKYLTDPEDQCSRVCNMACPNPVYDDTQYNTMVALRVAPHLLSIPLSCLVAFSIVNKYIKANSKSAQFDTYTFATAALALVYSLFDAIPVLILKFDLRCNGEAMTALSGPSENLYGHPICAFLNINIHLLQIFIGTAVCQLFTVCRKLQASVSMKKSKLSVLDYLTISSLVFFLPVLSFIMATVLEEDYLRENFFFDWTTGDSMYTPNNVRYAFSCGHKMNSTPLEAVVLFFPFTASGLVSLYCSYKIRNINSGSSIQSTGSKGEKKKSVKEARKADEDSALARISRLLLRFVAISCLCVGIIFITSILLLNSLQKYALYVGEWKACVSTGITLECRNEIAAGTKTISDCEVNTDMSLAAGEKLCGDFDGGAPSPILPMLWCFGLSFPTLAFGLILSRHHLKKLKEKVVPVSTKIALASTVSGAQSRAN